MFEFPLNLADYLHRVGRTARGGRAGRVTTITPRRFWPFVTKIQEAAKAGKPIEAPGLGRWSPSWPCFSEYGRAHSGANPLAHPLRHRGARRSPWEQTAQSVLDTWIAGWTEGQQVAMRDAHWREGTQHREFRTEVVRAVV